MADLGFFRDESARQLRAGSSRIIAYVFLDAGNPFFSDVARGAEEAGRESRLALVMCNSDGAVRVRTSTSACCSSSASAASSSPPWTTTASGCGPCRRWVCHWCSSTGQPLEATSGARRSGRRARRRPRGDPPDRAGSSAHRVRRRSAVTPAGCSPSRGWTSRSEVAGRPASDLVVLETEELHRGKRSRGGSAAGRPPKEAPPTAVFCANDLVALGMLEQLISRGSRSRTTSPSWDTTHPLCGSGSGSANVGAPAPAAAGHSICDPCSSRRRDCPGTSISRSSSPEARCP